MRPRVTLTQRALREAWRQVGEDGLDVPEVAGRPQALGGAPGCGRAREHGTPLINVP